MPYRNRDGVLNVRAMPLRSSKKLGWVRATVCYLRDPNASIFGKLLVVFAAVYVVCPVDLIPDVPVIGWLDDIGVVALVGAWLTRRISAYRDPRVVEVTVLDTATP